uniref:Uncharacterized protein n=1 Tax=Meloidogyne hapla TaxID=6305 RepID=A0A1I8C1H8_MELHA
MSLPPTTILKEEEIPIPIPPLPALTSIVIEICNKFLANHTKRPSLFLLMFNEFCDLLIFSMKVNGSFDWKELIKQKPSWFDASPIDQILSANLLNLLEMLIFSILPKPSNENLFLISNSALCVVLAENIADFLERIFTEIGPTFASFSIISIILSNFERCISYSLTSNSTRTIKQSLGILICSHPLINNLLLNLILKNEDKWLVCLFKRIANLSVKCVAKGGALSLTGCAILQKLFVYLKNIKIKTSSNILLNSIEEILARNIWLASCYSLFPVRILISQFNENSPGDLINNEGNLRVSYRLGLTPEEVEESVNNVRQLANQLFQLNVSNEKTIKSHESSKIEEENTANICPNFPGKFAYLFLFENKNEGKRLSMGLDELLDSLLCHQLIIQISTELILFNENNNELILGLFYVTLEICEQFEKRQGLKNILQKLTDLPSSANLWNIYLSTINSLIKTEINQTINTQTVDQKEDNLNEKSHIKQIIYFLKIFLKNDEKQENTINNTRNLAFTKLLILLEENIYNNSIFENVDLEKKTEMIKFIKLTISEEIEHLLLSEKQSKEFSISINEALELFNKKLLS